MKLFRSLSEKIPLPLVLTIGYFDGVHLGHQKVLDRVKALSHEKQMASAVLTFENHPSTILRHENSVCSLYSLPHKLQVIEDYGIEVAIVIPFTRELSEWSAKEFLVKLKNSFAFSHLILGHDAAFGKERQGDRKLVEELSRSLHFLVEYISPVFVGETPVSSSIVRTFLQEGKLELVEYLLDRKYSIFGQPISSHVSEYPSVKLELKNVCLPPSGAYAVKVVIQGKLTSSVGYLSSSTLEVLLLDKDLADMKELEVIFYRFLRPAMNFSSAEEHNGQIAEDLKDLF